MKKRLTYNYKQLRRKKRMAELRNLLLNLSYGVWALLALLGAWALLTTFLFLGDVLKESL